jgi:ABC-type multidrug transport system ATPase subunit
MFSQFILIDMSHQGIHIEELSKQFKGRTIFHRCSLTVEPGTVFGLVGRNGAGKTTLIRIVLGLLKQNAGSISVLGRTPWRHEPLLYQRLGVVLENDGFAPNLTVRENIRMFAAAKNIAWTDVQAYIAAAWSETFISAEFSGGHKKMKYLSRGQKVQCGICRAFLGAPDVIIMDEPTVALDVDAYDHVSNLIRKARERGAAVLISSHQLSAIEDLCDSVGILHNGALNVLNTHHADTQEWRIAADNDPCYAAVIRHYTGNEPVYHDGAWHCTVTEPDTSVPDIVRLLVHAGCSIREVTPIHITLKEHIRAYYEKD